MSIAKAEELKQQLTDKYVVVKEGVPELRRFAGLTGTVKTVNMNNRALVQFDGPADIAWYDIDPRYLTVINAPLPKKKGEGHKTEGEAKKPPAVAKPVAAAKPVAGGKSPLELAREQAAATGAPPAGEKKLSPLEMARMQGAAKSGGTATAESAPAPAAGAKKLSPLEMARLQGAAKPAAPKAEAPVPVPAAEPVSAPVTPQPAPVKVSATTVEKPGSTAEILDLIRKQGPYKG